MIPKVAANSEQPKLYVRDRLQSLCVECCGSFRILCRVFKELQNYLLDEDNWKVVP